MRLLLAIAAGINVLAAIFCLVGICSYNWFIVSYSTVLPIRNNDTIDITSTFSIFGIVAYNMRVTDPTTGQVNVTTEFLDHWENKTSCTGDNCAGTTFNANLDCSQLVSIENSPLENQTTQDFRSWYAGAACTYPKPTIAMITLGLIALSVGVPFTGMAAFELAKPIIPLIMNAIAFLWVFLAMCIYGGGVASHARSADWTDDNAMVLLVGITLFPDPNGANFGLGYAYALPCTAMFLILIVIALIVVEWRKDPSAGGGGGGGKGGHEMQRV